MGNMPKWNCGRRRSWKNITVRRCGDEKENKRYVLETLELPTMAIVRNICFGRRTSQNVSISACSDYFIDFDLAQTSD